jgi:hypothetical protein
MSDRAPGEPRSALHDSALRDIQPVKALYYPHIQFDSVPWLRAALLYWEGVMRLVPDGFGPWDRPEVEELVKAGLIESVSPARYLASARDVFAANLEELLQTHLGRALGLNRESGALIHVSEIDPGLLRDLQARGLAAAAGEWATMSPDLATLYKIALANEAGRELHAAPASDESGRELAGMSLASRKLTRTGNAMAPIDGFAFASLLSPFPAIQYLPLSTSELLDLRRRWARQRRAFREHVQARVGAIDALPSIEAIRHHLNDLASDIEGEARAQRAALKTSDAMRAWKIVTVSAPAALGAGIAFAGAPLLVAVGGVVGSLGLGAADWLWQRWHERLASGNYLVVLEEVVRRRGTKEVSRLVRAHAPRA